jgi:hypothetical protein
VISTGLRLALSAIEMASAVTKNMKSLIQNAVQVSLAALALAGCGLTPPAREPEAPLVPAAGLTARKAEPATSLCAETFRVFDSDRDHRISLEELADQLHPSSNADLVFRQRDRDVDGFLIEREFCARHGATVIVTPVPER